MATQERIIQLTVIGTKRHCNNDCPLMAPDAKSCFFGQLTWDPRRKYNGNKRLPECRQAEVTEYVG